MPRSLSFFLLPLLTLFFGLVFSVAIRAADPTVAGSTLPVVIVRDGTPASVVVLPTPPNPALETLAKYFVSIVERSTGAKLPIITAENEIGLPARTGRVYVGETPQSRAAGLAVKDLGVESYRVMTRGNSIFLLGRDDARQTGIHRTEPVSQPTRWALNRLLEEQLGIRWLWPGELGTYVPKHASFSVPPIDVTYQPKLTSRVLVSSWTLRAARRDAARTEQERTQILTREQDTIQPGIDWLENHQGGGREASWPSHAFTGWWGRYGKDHPDYFAEPPPGKQPALWRPGSIKLRLANPAVIDQIAAEYQAAGAPDIWHMTPNDAAGYDTSDATRAWDIPKDQPIQDIWSGKANLTARYVTFWNKVYERLSAINPKVTLTALAYGAYRNPPLPGVTLKARMKMGIVPGYGDESYTVWKGWSDLLGTGGIRLRPNWWHLGANAPHLPLEEIYRYMKFCWENRMDSIRMDSLMGFWGTQGPSYYLVARYMIRPDLTKAAILNEFVSAFGSGAPSIHRYLDYWQSITSKHDKMISHIPSVQKFFAEARAGRYDLTSSSSQALFLPYLYPNVLVDPAYKILDEASKLIDKSESEAAQRVAFLRSGLDEMCAARDTIALGTLLQEKSGRTPERIEEFKRKAEALARLRNELSARQVVWGGPVSRTDYNRSIPVAIENVRGLRTKNKSAGDDTQDLR